MGDRGLDSDIASKVKQNGDIFSIEFLIRFDGFGMFGVNEGRRKVKRTCEHWPMFDLKSYKHGSNKTVIRVIFSSRALEDFEKDQVGVVLGRFVDELVDVLEMPRWMTSSIFLC